MTISSKSNKQTTNGSTATNRRGYILIGLSGTNGAGKDSVGLLLEARAGFKFISLTDMLREEAVRRGQPIERSVLREISRQWRHERGGGVLVDVAIDHYEAQFRDSHPVGLAVASLRNKAEPDTIHAYGGVVVWVDGDPQIRYNRIQRDRHRRGESRAAEDNITFEQFTAEEHAELFGYSDDPHSIKMADVKVKADSTIINDIMIEGDAGHEALWQTITRTLKLKPTA